VRIASLVPSATEMLFALGLGEQVVGVTHECDFPPEASSRRQLTRSVIPEGLSAREIDAAVRERTGEGRHLYELDEAALSELRVDLIVTQAVCEVCAVSYDDAVAVGGRLATHPAVISLDPERLAEVLADVSRLGEAAGAAERAAELRERLDSRLAAVREAVAGAPRPRVLALEWLDPPFIGGHWVPEMIVIAGGEDALGVAGSKSRTAGWDELAASAPEVVVAMPCGWDARQAVAEAQEHARELAAAEPRQVWAVDAVSSFSRPGPRLVEGVELLAHLFHPDQVDAPAGVGFEEVRIGDLAVPRGPS
jgi:iron complex transport system substrate-binding protein